MSPLQIDIRIPKCTVPTVKINSLNGLKDLITLEFNLRLPSIISPSATIFFQGEL